MIDITGTLRIWLLKILKIRVIMITTKFMSHYVIFSAR